MILISNVVCEIENDTMMPYINFIRTNGVDNQNKFKFRRASKTVLSVSEGGRNES